MTSDIALSMTNRETELSKMTDQELIENLSATLTIVNKFSAVMTEAFSTECREENKMILAELGTRV